MNLSLDPAQIRPAISKCVSNTESELKYKHVRMLLLHTHHPDHYVIIWENFIILSRIKVNAIAAFKFCHLLHRLLRDGSQEFLVHSERCLFVLQDFEKDWMSFVSLGQLDSQGYLLCSVKYCHYIMDKIVFHAKYKQISGNLSLQNVDMISMLDKSRKDGTGFSSVEFTSFVLKLLEGIIDVQNLIFANIKIDTVKSETLSCRMLALIPIIEDAKKLYFIAVQSLHYLHLHTTYGTLQQMEARLVKLFPAIRQFFTRSKSVTLLDGKVWIPQISDTPPKFAKPAEPSRTFTHSISQQPTKSTSLTPTLKRNVSSSIAALQRSVVIPRNKIEVVSKPLPPIPNASTSNNRQVYEDDDNIYEELDPQDDEYFTDSDFDSTDDDYDEAEVDAAKDKFKKYYESGGFPDAKSDPRAMLQKVLVSGIPRETYETTKFKNIPLERGPVQPNVEQEDDYDIPVIANFESNCTKVLSNKSDESHSSTVVSNLQANFTKVLSNKSDESHSSTVVSNFQANTTKVLSNKSDAHSSFVNECYEDIYGARSISVIDVPKLSSQLRLLEEKVARLERDNLRLSEENRKLLEENSKLKKAKPLTEPKPTIENGGLGNKSSISWEGNAQQRMTLRDSVLFFESKQNNLGK